ncbi:hypothetical protein IU397_03560 [Actibacterium sp. 188UL27-1]|nr:hypothetical protein [Actibacterium sp. 188UL27-1]
MMRAFLPICAVLTVAACADPQAPYTTSDRGVGFGDYNAYTAEQTRRRSEREQQLRQNVRKTRPETTGAPTPQQALRDPVISAQATTPEQVGAPISALRTQPVDVATAPASTVITPAGNSAAISNSQDFAAASAQDSIESNAERLRQQKANYETVAVAPVPQRSNTNGPNIVAFALQTNHAVGQPVYRRSFASGSRASRACGRYASPDLAQEAFLANGGPQRDRRGMDPDGDGFACGWDPSPFRLARQG